MPGHDTLAKEAVALMDALTVRLEKTAAAEPHDVQRCTGCPLCAALTYLDGHRELAAQLAQGALLVLSALRQYLDQPTAATSPAPEPVQRIDIS